MPPMEFTGKVAVITGAGSGIGRATALMLGRCGAVVHVVDVNEASADGVAAEIEQRGGRATAHYVDVSDSEAVESLAARVFEDHGAVDILHNNAGIGIIGPIENTTLDDWRRMIDVNLMGVVYGIHSFVPRMLRQGRRAHIVNTASMAGLVPFAHMVPYCTAKHGIVGMSQALNAELSPRGIRVTVLCFGVIKTGLSRAAELRGELASRRDRAIRLNDRLGVSADVAARAVLDAIRHDQIIRTAPRHHVIPTWALWRISPRLVQPLARLNFRVLTGR